MTFQEFYAERLAAGMPDNAVNRTLCQAAWDTALCTASAACLDRGKMRDPHAIHAAIGQLHTWVTSSPQTHTP